MRLLWQKERDRKLLLRFMASSGEVAYMVFGLSGLQAEIEFPSDWHDDDPPRAWVRLCFGLMKIGLSFPWRTVVPDDYQCSGPTYGFNFFDDLLFVRWGKAHGRKDDPSKAFYMPWAWKHREHKILSEPETHPYTYVLRSGEIQIRMATIKMEYRRWTRWWLPCKLERKTIDVTFDGEVGERSGSWKGGTIGCGYDMREGETALGTLRRMERERKF